MSLVLADTQTPDLLSLTPTTKANIIQHEKPWGRLYSTYIHLEPVDLKLNSYSLGRAENCDIVITEDKVPIHRIIAISKSHFEIHKEDSLVYITDHSKNGTFLNGKLIGKGKTNLLQNDDEISIGFKGLKVYIFKVLSGVDNNTYLPEKLRKKYQVSRLLGRGACGEVKLVLEKETLKPYAVKKISKTAPYSDRNLQMNRPDKIQREITILKSLNHPCVMETHDIEETEDSVYIILEYMEGGELTDLIQTTHPINESEAKFLFYQIALALNYLHSKHIIHRDLKPENILLKNTTPDTLLKISDFGLSRFIFDDDEEAYRTICGTPMYAAPEIIARKMYSYEVDIWSLGVVLYYMLAKEVPFKPKNMAGLHALIRAGTYNFNRPAWNDISDEAKDLVRKMMTVDRNERIKLDDVLKHPWITEDSEMIEKVDDLIFASMKTTFMPESPNTSDSSSCASSSPPSKRARSSDQFW